MNMRHPLTQKLIMATLLISLFGCFQKKEKKNDLSSWLESNFPGQLEVVNNIVNLDLKNLYIKKTSTIVADKSDPEVQIVITWFKEQQPDLGVSVDEVKTSLVKSKDEVAAARNLFSKLKQNGLDKISVGVIEMAAYILIFDEPSPALRKPYLEKILATLDALPDHEQTSIWIEWMEPAAYQEHFKDIIPYGYWQRGDSYQESNKIMSLDFEWSPGLKPDILMTGWAINSSSARSGAYLDEAYKAASAWAGKNIHSPFYLEPAQMVQMGPVDDDPMAIEFSFPYFDSKPDTEQSDFEDSALGYVTGVYQTDQKTFTKIRKTDEL